MLPARHRFFPATLSINRSSTPARRAYPQDMRLLEALAGAFFRTFGITEPTPQTRRRAAWFILGMFTLIVVGFLTAGAILFHML